MYLTCMSAHTGRTVNISVGETAVYECAACSRIDWLLNGTDLNNLNMTSRDIMIMVSAADESIRVSTLSIIGRLVYNSTSIGCQALDSPEKLPDVYLYVHRLQCPGTTVCYHDTFKFMAICTYTVVVSRSLGF